MTYDELPLGVVVLRTYAKKGATVGASLVECFHHPEHRSPTGVCRICRSTSFDRPVKQLATVLAPRKPREPVQEALSNPSV